MGTGGRVGGSGRSWGVAKMGHGCGAMVCRVRGWGSCGKGTGVLHAQGGGGGRSVERKWDELLDVGVKMFV